MNNPPDPLEGERRSDSRGSSGRCSRYGTACCRPIHWVFRERQGLWSARRQQRRTGNDDSSTSRRSHDLDCIRRLAVPLSLESARARSDPSRRSGRIRRHRRERLCPLAQPLRTPAAVTVKLATNSHHALLGKLQPLLVQSCAYARFLALPPAKAPSPSSILAASPCRELLGQNACDRQIRWPGFQAFADVTFSYRSTPQLSGG